MIGMRDSVKNIPIARLALLSSNMTLGRSKFLGRLQVSMRREGESKTVFGSELIKKALKHLSIERDRSNALVILSRLKQMSAPKPKRLIARIIQTMVRLFSKDALTKLKANLHVQRAENWANSICLLADDHELLLRWLSNGKRSFTL